MEENHLSKESFEDLLGDSHRVTADIATQFILRHPRFFKEALSLSLADKPTFSMRAARVVQLVAEKEPEMSKPFLENVFEKLFSLKEEGAVRSLLKMISLQVPDLNENQQGMIINACFDWIQDSSTAIAIQVYSLEILYRISNLIPEIKPELIAILQSKSSESSAGIKSRSGELLKKLYEEVL